MRKFTAVGSSAQTLEVRMKRMDMTIKPIKDLSSTGYEFLRLMQSGRSSGHRDTKHSFQLPEKGRIPRPSSLDWQKERRAIEVMMASFKPDSYPGSLRPVYQVKPLWLLSGIM